MGWFQKLLGRDDPHQESASAHSGQGPGQARQVSPAGKGSPTRSHHSSDDVPVPMGVFRKYQQETTERFRELRTQYREVVDKNDSLQRMVNDFGHRLDQIQKEHASFRQDTKESLTEVRRDVARIAIKEDPVMRAQLNSAESALSVLGPVGPEDSALRQRHHFKRE